MCGNRIKGTHNCTQQSAFLEVYEEQLEAHFTNFVIPRDYQERVLEAHRKSEA